MSDDEFDFDFSTDLARLAFKIGKELGKEAKNAGRFQRGELEWDELSHAQKYLYLGGDQSEYEKIRNMLKQNNNRKSSSGRSNLDNIPEKPNRIRNNGRFFNYEDF